MYDCRYLPPFADYILKNHITDYAAGQLDFGRKLNVPILNMLSARFSEEQLINISIESTREYLQYLAENKAYDQITTSMSKWLKDQLEIVGKMDITAKDITLINFMRGQGLKKLIPFYTSDITVVLGIISDIDSIILGSTTTAVDIYIDILKTKIDEQSNLATKVIEASPAITFLFDVITQTQTFISGNVTNVMGYTPAEVSSMRNTMFEQLTHPEDIEPLFDHIRQVIQENSNQTKQIEYRFKHKDGNYRWLRTYDVIFKRDESGKPLQVLGKTFEISHEKEIGMALEKREQQLLEAQAIAQIGSYEWNMKENTSTNTAELFRIFEMEQDHQHYEQFLSHVHKDDIQKVKDAIAVSFQTGHYECEYRYKKNDHEKVIWSLGRVEFIEGKPYRMVGTVQDVTRIKKMEKDLMEKSRELAQSNESLRQFAFVASHDMKEPLRKIMMFSDMLIMAEKGNISDKSVTQLQKMQTAGRNLYRMVEDILSFSLLEITEEKQKVSLDTIVGEVVELLEETIREKNANIIHKDLPEANIIQSQFRQLFQNLIANSLKFSKKNTPPVIQISGTMTANPSYLPPVTSEKYLELNVTDNGIGFPEEAQEKIFELFSRMHPKSEYQGTGLGLSISRRIIDNHNGVIRAHSKNNNGSTFTVVIPQ
jgi:PAS domain S-box-containing protein